MSGAFFPRVLFSPFFSQRHGCRDLLLVEFAWEFCGLAAAREGRDPPVSGECPAPSQNQPAVEPAGRSPVKSAGRSKLKFVGRRSLKPATPNGSWKGFKYAKMLENCRIYRTILLKLFTFSQILQGVPKLSHATVFIYCRNLIYLTYGKIW